MRTRRNRTRIAASLFVLAAGTLVSPARAQDSPVPVIPDLVQSVTVIPPGQDGAMDLVQFAEFQAADSRPEHYDDQLEMYAGLVDDDDVTPEDLLTHYHSQQFGPEEIVEEYSPREGVTVYRDALSVPHIYGDTLENTEFAVGYVTAQDRLFQADVFRHAALGTLASFVGPSYVEMDKAIRREGYTEEELQKMLDALPKIFPQRGFGQSIIDGIEAYTEGMNAYIDEVSADPTIAPAEYFATGNYPPEPWRAIDTAALGVLQLRVFGETAGAELRNGELLRELGQKLGPTIGQKVFNDLRRRNDPSAYTSIATDNGRWPSQRLPKANPRAIAIPDEPAPSEEPAAQDARAVINDGLARIGFPTLGSAASNALLVSGRRSTSGHPLQIGAPQVGYSVPQFFIDLDVHGGTPERRLDFRGAAVPGASLVAAVGRGIDYAWTLTTGMSDAVDVRAELLCEPDGKKPTVDSKHYVFRGKCRAMTTREETISWNMPPTALLDPATAQPPGSETIEIDRTRHGPVFSRGTVRGKPVAWVRQRQFWQRELESFAAFSAWNSSSETKSMADFFRAADWMTVSFNVFYADAKNIGYHHIGEYPVRAAGVDPRLPTWGTGAWEWKGVWPFSRNPHVRNPKQGWLVNWNNKPAASWGNGDDTAWGDVQRVRLLATNMRERLAGGKKIDRADLVDVIRDAATRDMSAFRLLPQFLTPIKNAIAATPAPADKDRLAEAVGILEAWYAAGQHRADQDHDGNDDNGPATAIFDAWYDATVAKVFEDELGDAMGLAGVPRSDRPEFNNGSSYFADFGNYLANLLSRRPLARNYCDDLKTTAVREGCGAALLTALRSALEALTTAQETEDLSALTRPADTISFEAQGGGSVPDIPWQNRGTYNHVAEITARRP
jgi:acyl-homoserine lactone acylase PvdQ